MNKIFISSKFIESTLMTLQEAGRRNSECVVLWLGKRNGEGIEVTNVWRPAQQADFDYFEIPELAMESVFRELKKNRGMIAAQVHSHPLEAFHSEADNQWAIVRHTGALSIVLPYFASYSKPETFEEDIALFKLSAGNEWQEVPVQEHRLYYQINP